MGLGIILIIILIIGIIVLVTLRKKDKPEKTYRSTDEVMVEVQEKLQSGMNPVGVIKFVREETGLGLVEAKELVERVDNVQADINNNSTDIENTVQELLQIGETPIEVIKYVREETGLGLKEAKEIVNRVQKKI